MNPGDPHPAAAAGPHQRRHRHWRLLGGIVLALLGLGIATRLAWRASDAVAALPVVRFPNGAELRVLGVSAGTNSFRYDPLHWRIARRLLPEKWRSRIPPGWSNHTYSLSSNSVYIHILRTKGSFGYPSIAALDETGFRLPRGGGWSNRDFSSSALQVFPRRLKKFRVTIYDATQEYGTITIRNPFYRKYEVWTPDPMPVTRTNGPVALTLMGLKLKTMPIEMLVHPEATIQSTDPYWAQATLFPWAIRLEDATGNSIGWHALSPAERAWRVHPRLYRTNLEAFAPHELLTCSNVPVPAAGQSVVLGKRAELGEVLVSLRYFSGPGSVAVTNIDAVSARSLPAAVESDWRLIESPTSPPPGHHTGGGSSSAGHSENRYEEETKSHGVYGQNRPFVLVGAYGMQPGDELFVGASRGADNAAWKASPFPAFPSTVLHESRWSPRMSDLGRDRFYYVPLDIPEGVTHVSLHVAVSRPLQFAFTVKPPQP